MAFFSKLFKGLILPLALGFAFAALGPAGGFFAKFGMGIGMTLGSLLFNRPKMPNILGGISQPKSEYDTGIPFCLGGDTPDGRKGGIKLPSIFIDGDPAGLIEEKTGKKTERWFSGALLWCEGVTAAKTVVKIWANDTVVFDATGADAKKRGFALTQGADGVWSGTHYSDTSQKLRNYPGNFKQGVDPYLAQLHGADKTPAYRGCCYSLLEHFTLKDFDYSLPNFRALVVDNLTGSAQIVTALALRVGVPADKIQLTALSTGGAARALRGVIALQPTPAKELAEDVCNWNFIDLIDCNGRIEDRDRKNPVFWDITPGELGAHDEGEQAPARVRLRVESKLDLPSTATLRFIDVDLNYEVNTASAFVQNNLHQGEQEKSFEISIVASHQEGGNWIKPALDEALAARFPCEVSLPFRRLAIGPGDVLRVPLQQGPSDDPGAGEVHEIRITNQSTSLPGPIACEGLSYDSEVYADHRIATPISPRPPAIVPTFDAPNFVFIDSIALSDDDIFQPSVYAAINAGFIRYPRGLATLECDAISGLHYQINSNLFDEMATMGAAATALAIGSTVGFDDSQTLTIDLESGQMPFNVTENDVLFRGRNWAFLKSGNNWEIIGWTTATRDAANDPPGKLRYRLSHLKRGIRKTDKFMAGHAVGDTFVLIDDAVRQLTVNRNFLGVATAWKTRIEYEYTNGSFTFQGNNVKPLPPLDLMATYNASNGDWVGKWTPLDKRQTAPAGYNGEGAATSQIAFYDATGALIHVYSNPDPGQFTLTSALQAAHFGGPQDTVRFTVRIISGVTPAPAGTGFESAVAEFTKPA